MLQALEDGEPSSGGAGGVFGLARGNNLSRRSVDVWLQASEELVGSYRTLKDQNVLLSEYLSLLSKASVSELDPMTMATFDMLSGSIMDTLIKMQEVGPPITDLIDKVTDVHLDFIEEFQKSVDDGGSDGYSQSANQEFLAYQFAGLVYRTYSKISRGLGADFDLSAEAVDMRTNNWVSTVYARLQRRFVRFLASNVEETVEEQNAASFEKFVGRLNVSVEPPYTLDFSEQRSGAGGEEYPPWVLTASLMKIIRNVISETDKERLEPPLVRQFQNEISASMRRLGRPLAPLAADRDGTLRGNNVLRIVDDEQKGKLTALLNCGHASVAAVLSLWQVRHNIVGVADVEGRIVKDFLRSVSFDSPSKTLESIPKKLQKEGIEEAVEALLVDTDSTGNERLRSAALLAHAVRSTASDDFRALITYNADSSDIPTSRDSLYQLLLRCVVEQAILPREEDAAPLDSVQLLEHLVALAALEETLGVREPRAACTVAFQEALHSVSLDIADILQQGDSGRDVEWAARLGDRVTAVGASLVAINRLPHDVLGPCRLKAFKGAIDGLMSTGATDKGAFTSGRQRVEGLYPALAAFLGLSAEKAKSFVLPLGQERFDKAVGSVLMSADLVAGLEDDAARLQGEQSRDQLFGLADDVMIPRDVAKQRVLLLGGVVIESMVETALEEHRRMNEDMAGAALQKAANLQKHPLWRVLRDGASSEADVTRMAGKMVVSRLGLPLVQEVLRMLDSLLKRQSGGGAEGASTGGWGSVKPSGDAEYAAFLQDFRAILMYEYNQASIG